MKYTHMLLITLVISLIWGLLLFIFGFIIRFQQAMLVNRYVANLESDINPKACMPPNMPQINVCPYKTEFDTVELGSWANSLGSITIFTGFIIIAMSGCGFLGVIKRSQGLLLLMLVLIIVGIGLEYYLLDIILNGSGSFHDSAKAELVELMASKYQITKGPANEFTLLWTAIMLAGECCGIRDGSDISLNLTISYGQPVTTYYVSTAPACCSREAFIMDDSTRAFEDIMNCAGDQWAIKATTTGCYSLIHSELYNSYGASGIGFLMFLILWEGVQGILLFMIILRPAPKSPRKSAASSGGSARSGPRPPQVEIPKKKFTPFSKVSSYIASDINRIKSTEIW